MNSAHAADVRQPASAVAWRQRIHHIGSYAVHRATAIARAAASSNAPRTATRMIAVLESSEDGLVGPLEAGTAVVWGAAVVVAGGVEVVGGAVVLAGAEVDPGRTDEPGTAVDVALLVVLLAAAEDGVESCASAEGAGATAKAATAAHVSPTVTRRQRIGATG
jgi:hypothetical protein